MYKSLFIIFLSSLMSWAAMAQGVDIRGKVVDAGDNSAVASASVVIFKAGDSSAKKYAITDTAGVFGFTGIEKDNYIVNITFFSYKPLVVKVPVADKNIYLGRLKLNAINLKEVKIVGRQVRAEQIGDTVQYHADAFKTNPDATAEDLVTKMPGIVVQNGTVQAHGEDVKKVLVDGKPYFGDDPSAALRNLPAEVVDKVQVFDQMSDQSQFTGFDDGNTSKTINIITKKDRRSGVFGRAVVGGGTDNIAFKDPKYQAMETLSIFDKNRRISIIGLSNNINQQNFTTQDLLGLSGNSGNGGGRGGGGGRPGVMFTSRGGGGGGFNPGGGSISNFLVGQQGGINTTNSAGLNYSDSIGHHIAISGSYFFNNLNNNTQSILARTYFPVKGVSPLYNETDQSSSKNYNHRANLRLEYTIDTLNSLVFTPKFSYQSTSLFNSTSGVNRFSTFDTANSSMYNSGLTSSGYDFNADLLWRHKFAKKGRTLSWDIGTDINPKTALDTSHYLIHYTARPDSISNQQYTSPSKSMNFSTSLSYTEPIGKNGQLQVNYNPSYTQSELNKTTYLQSLPGGDYVVLDSALSNAYSYSTIVQKGGVSYRTRIKDINIMVGLNAQSLTLNGMQSLPVGYNVHDKMYNALLPTAMFSEKFENKSNLRLIYNTSMSAPSISQLQTVINNSNPLILSTGNPDLNNSYTHSFMVRYGKTNTDKAHSFFLFASLSGTTNYIGNSTVVAFKDSLLPGGYKLARGAQLVSPVNLSSAWFGRAFATFGMPLDFIKSNLNLNMGFFYNNTPGLLNNQLNTSNTYGISPGIVLSSNISENLDFTLAYYPNYNIVKNTVNTQANNNYFTHLASFKINWIFWKGFTFSADISHNLYSGLESQYNQNLLIVNGGIGKKLFKDQSGEIRLSVFDALNNNTSISRSVTDTYIDDIQTQVLKRYFMLTFSYNLKRFKSAAQ